MFVSQVFARSLTQMRLALTFDLADQWPTCIVVTLIFTAHTVPFTMSYTCFACKKNKQIKHALMVGIGDFLTSIFCGAVVFTMIGYMAAALDKPIESIVQSGTGI